MYMIMSVSSTVSGSHHNIAKLSNWESFQSQLSLDIPSQDEFISDVRRPSLLSVTLSDSICSNSSLECNDLNPECEEEPVKDTDMPLQQSTCQYQINQHDSRQKSYNTKKFHEVSKKPLELEDLKVPSAVSDTPQKAALMKSLSMHDVSGIPTFTLGMKQNSAASCETIHSQSLSSTTKSKDSGFHRSVSCLSLNSGSRSYDHVQSKVKEYIRGIKEREAERKKFVGKQHSDEEKPESTINIDTLDTEDLVETISKMELELKEKSVLLDTQQKNYNALLKKLAEAENTIDQLRLRRSSNFYDSYHSSRDSLLYNSQPYSFLNSSSNTSLRASVEKLYLSKPKDIPKDSTKQKDLNANNDNRLSNSNKISNIMSPCVIVEKAEAFSPGGCSTPTTLQNPPKSELRPVTRLFSSSCRLDKTFTPLTKTDNNSKLDYYSRHSMPQNRSKIEQTGALDQSEGSLFSYKNCIQQRRKKFLNGVGNHIDLPKVDPFDKVKKWQASLPSIHLLGYDNSTSNSDACDSALKSPQLVRTLKKSVNKYISKQSLHGANITSGIPGVGRFTKSEQDLSCLKSFSSSSRYIKNSCAKTEEKQNNRICENKFGVSSSSQKCTDLSLPLYLTTYQPKHSTYDDEVETNNDSNVHSELRTKYYGGLSMKSDDCNNKANFIPLTQYHTESISDRMLEDYQTRISCKNSQISCTSADSVKPKHLHAASSYNSDHQCTDSVNIKDCKREVISHCYWTNICSDMSDCQKQPVTTVSGRGHTKSGNDAHVKKTLNSISVVRSVSEFSVPERSEGEHDKTDYKTHTMLTGTLRSCLTTERQDSEDNPSVSSSNFSSLNEYNCQTPSSYKSFNSPKRKKCIGNKKVPSKIKKIADQEQSILPVINSEIENGTEKCKRLEINGNKYNEDTLEHPVAIHNSELRKCKKISKNDLKSVLVNHYKNEQGTQKHLVADKLLEERNFLFAKQTPLPVDDLENELLTDTYTLDKSLKESLKDSEYFASLMSVRLRKMKKAIEDIQPETQQTSQMACYI